MSNALDRSNDRLSILYIISSYGEPVPYTLLMSAILNGHFMEYIDFNQLISDLEEDGYILRFGDDTQVKLTLTTKGEETLNTLGDLVSQYAVRFADLYLPSTNARSSSVVTSYQPDDIGRFTVSLTLTEGGHELFDLKLPAYSKKDALSICETFEKHSTDIYSEIINSILKNRE